MAALAAQALRAVVAWQKCQATPKVYCLQRWGCRPPGAKDHREDRVTMTIKTILLSSALALSCIVTLGATAQTAKDYARYSTYNTPRSQGQNANGMRIFIFAGLK